MPDFLPSSFAVIAKTDNPDARNLGQILHNWLREQGLRSWLGFHDGGGALYTAVPQADLALVLGGDGTFVSVTRTLMGRDIPLAGVNFGRVGFLSRIEPSAWKEFFAALLAGRLSLESRLALTWKHFREDRLLASGWAVNDALLSRREPARLIALRLAVNDNPLMDLRADGVILATPTGSSGYAHSAGGPLLFPSLPVYAAVAVCPYLSAFSPLVLEGQTRLRLTVEKGNLALILDGQEVHALQQGDGIEIHGVPGAFRVVEMEMNSYFTKLRALGFIREERVAGSGQTEKG
ncbi:MAG: NAD(+)/NADH kinase [Desulfovibrio sp.]|jgi:NAD+ kinase|nr:NAD(+)/NADH kinase [Desulfovibrio sp.]